MKPTIILRHQRENLKKCSLRGLERRDDFLFYTYPKESLPNLSSYILLKVDAPPLTEADQHLGLFLLDGTWRLAEKMESQIKVPMQRRSLPGNYKTAYPRRQTECPDPDAGLSSIEALFIAYQILKRPTKGLLDQYHWKERFLQLNALAE